jgi:hypothetical protein
MADLAMLVRLQTSRIIVTLIKLISLILRIAYLPRRTAESA